MVGTIQGLQIGIQGLQIGIQVISILFSGLLIYCSVKVQPINKPPGSLILVELILTYIIQLIGLANRLIFDLSEPQSPSIGFLFTSLIAIRFYLTIVNYHYECCIVLELYLRLRVKKNNQPFRKRAIIYHAVSNFLALCVTVIMMVAYITIVARDGDSYGMLNYKKWIFWFQISYFTLNIATFVTIASITGYKNSKLVDSSVKRFIVLVIVRVILLALLILESIVIENIDDEQDKFLANTYISYLYFDICMIPYIFRMFDPHIKQFLRHKVRSMKYNIQDKINYMIGRRRYISEVDQTLIPVSKLFDDIMIENIEYQLISLVIAMLKYQDNYDEV
jgi:hypothetical protein